MATPTNVAVNSSHSILEQQNFNEAGLKSITSDLQTYVKSNLEELCDLDHLLMDGAAVPLYENWLQEKVESFFQDNLAAKNLNVRNV